METAASQYGVPVLMTDSFHEVCTLEMRPV